MPSNVLELTRLLWLELRVAFGFYALPTSEDSTANPPGSSALPLVRQCFRIEFPSATVFFNSLICLITFSTPPLLNSVNSPTHGLRLPIRSEFQHNHHPVEGLHPGQLAVWQVGC